MASDDKGSTSSEGKGSFGGFVLHFHNGKCHRVADGKVFPIRMRQLHNISLRQTYRWKARFVDFLAIYSVSTSTSGFMKNWQKNNDDYSTKTQMQAANCCCPCCDNSIRRRRWTACIFMNARYGAMLHRPRPGQPVSTRPVPKLLWADLLRNVVTHKTRAYQKTEIPERHVTFYHLTCLLTYAYRNH